MDYIPTRTTFQIATGERFDLATQVDLADAEGGRGFSASQYATCQNPDAHPGASCRLTADVLRSILFTGGQVRDVWNLDLTD